MLWTELELDRIIPDARLAAAWTTAFGVDQVAVTIVDDIAETAPWTNPRTRIVLERRQQAGDFPLHVTVILGDEALDEAVIGPKRTTAMIRCLCAELDCRALVATDDLDPYRWLLVTPQGQIEPARLDVQQLDEADAFVLARQPAMTGG